MEEVKMEDDNIMEVTEGKDRKISFTKEEADEIRRTVKGIQKAVDNELNKSRGNEETKGRSR